MMSTPQARQLTRQLQAVRHIARGPTDRWHPALLSRVQLDYLQSQIRINVVAAGRRSFKTEAAKRRVVRAAIAFYRFPNGRFFACAPTHQQSKDIFWEDLKALTPDWALQVSRSESISESELSIRLINGAIIRVAGLDRPARIEGGDWDGGVITEYGSCKPGVFMEHVRPMMMRGGWCDIEGVPEGRNHYYELVMAIVDGKWPRAKFHQWTTEEVLHLWRGVETAEAEIAEARATMDSRTYQQEFQAAFVNFQGLAYYAYTRDLNCPPGNGDGTRVVYDPELPLVLCFDFNRAPGTCVVCQEHPASRYPWLKSAQETVTACVDEVFIRRNSTTPKVVEHVRERYGGHTGIVDYYGDPTGGQKHSSSTSGSDWDMIDLMLAATYGRRARNCVRRSAPSERARLNAVNSRLQSVDGKVGVVVDHLRCRELLHDFEGVEADDAGALVKEQGSPRSHLSDGIGYYIEDVHPVRPCITQVEAY